jgi:hypothetical protein
MSKNMAHADPVEMLAEWEGPAIPAPGVLFEEKQVENLSQTDDVAELVSWLAVTAFSRGAGNSASQVMNAKVLEVLTGWRRRLGEAKINEVKERLFQEMQKYRAKRKLTDEEVRERIRSLFDKPQVS